MTLKCAQILREVTTFGGELNNFNAIQLQSWGRAPICIGLKMHIAGLIDSDDIYLWTNQNGNLARHNYVLSSKKNSLQLCAGFQHY